ncbi:MAG TPA: tetratricopeptide repeat protein, partial [Planctomycetaceae bacterium]|nr:tetratricopeptide repeat protein [Planctomycetaceae bacterium]
ALELAPDDENVILFAARTRLSNKHADEARELVDRGRKLYPKNAAFFSLSADIELQSTQGDKREKAIEWLEQGAEVAGDAEKRDLLWNLCNLYLEQIPATKTAQEKEPRILKVRNGLESLREARYPKAPVDYLEARLDTVQDPPNWLKASAELEKTRVALVPWPDLLKQADFLLGQCYQELGRSDLQLSAYRRAAGVDPLWVPARMGVANALFSMGKVSEALQEYDDISKLTDNLAVRLQMARLMILANLRRGAAERKTHWPSIISALDLIEQSQPGLPQVVTLRAEVLLAQGDQERAAELLQSARDKSPGDLELWLGLAALAEQRRDWVAAGKLLEEAKAQIGDSVPLRLARARLLVNESGKDAAAALQELAQPGESYAPEEVLQLYSGLAGLAFSIEDFDETARLCAFVAKARSSDLRSRLLLFDTALRATQWTTEKRLSIMKDVLEEILGIEGKGPLWHYGTAVELRIMAEQAKSNGDEKQRLKYYQDARQHLTDAGNARPAWSRVPLLVAEINMAQGDDKAAIDSYLKAIDLGESNPSVLSRTVILLYQRRRFQQADELIRRLDQQVRSPFSIEMTRLAAEISLRLDQQESALRRTDEVTRMAKAASEYVWAGQIFTILKKNDEAERSFRKAIELDETASEPWIALIQFLRRTGQTEQAMAEFKNAEQKIKTEDAPLALARCIESISDRPEAVEERYEAALAAAPGDVSVIRRVADFYMRFQKPRKAEPLLTQIISGLPNATADDRIWARRNLAQALTSQQRDRGALEANIDKALKLIDQNLAQDATMEADRRVKALILALKSDKAARLEAISILEALLSDPQSEETPESLDERFVLAQLYMAQGESSIAKVRSQMEVLLRVSGGDRRIVRTYASYLEKCGLLAEAGNLLDETNDSKNPQPQDLVARFSDSLRTHFLRDEYDEVIKVLDNYIAEANADDKERVSRIRRTAATLEQFAEQLKRWGKEGKKPKDVATAGATQFMAHAEELLRQNVNSGVTDAMALAAFASRNGRADEALDLLEKNWAEAQPPEIAAVTTALMVAPGTSPLHLTRAEKILRESLAKKDRPVLLVQALADLQSWREKYDEAEDLYRETLLKDENPLALNNLALLLGLRGKGGKEALELIDKAIFIAGQDPSLLDSRATINLALGNPQQGVSDLVLVIEKRPSSVLGHFHQAQVALKLGKTDAARKSYERALEFGLQFATLHPLERDGLRMLEKEFPGSKQEQR